MTATVPGRPETKPPAAPVPTDEGLPGLASLLDAGRAWDRYLATFGRPEEPPERLRATQFIYRPGRRAVAAYVAERRWEQWVAEETFAIELLAGGEERVFRFPDDPYLPGLAVAADAAHAQSLLPRHVALRPQRLRVETARYRPSVRAVLRHIAGWRRTTHGDVTLYARVMPPRRVGRVLAAADTVARSGFGTPRVAGAWEEGGVVWLTETQGETLRSLIRAGTAPDPVPVLDLLASLWEGEPADGARPLDLQRSFLFTEEVLTRALPEGERGALAAVVERLRPFVASWRPAGVAHNDFYDDQMVVTPEGGIVLVDFEEAGPGDPLLDVGNWLAHLRWMARFGKDAANCEAYYGKLRAAALERFRWDARHLALREAYALFRLSSNPVRNLRPDWPRTARAGLDLALAALEAS